MRNVKKLPLETPINTRGFRVMGQDKLRQRGAKVFIFD
jgi:hypothetical protein